MKTLCVYQSYGNETGHTQTLYAILTALAFAPQNSIEIHLYTDNPAFFHLVAEKIHFHELTPERIQEWRGVHDFTHRLKIMMLLDLYQQFPQNPILYLDGDTFFTQPYENILHQITQETVLMHLKEYPVATHTTGQMKRFRKNIKPLQFQGQPIDLNVFMWNAGVIGFLPEHIPVLQKVIQFVDEIYPQYPKHIIEQFAVSYFFQKEYQIEPCDRYIKHYWNQKAEYTQAIQTFLNTHSATEKAIQSIHQEGLIQPTPVPKRKWWQKIFSR
jgi:hypothetical protein